MRKYIWAFLPMIILLTALQAAVQNMSVFSASKIQNGAGQLLASGTLYVQGTDANNTPISFQCGGGGQVVRTPFPPATVTTGAITSFNVCNPDTTLPRGIFYHIWVTDASTGQTVLSYAKVQWTGATFDLDTYTPGGAAVVPPAGGSVTGNLGINGNLAWTGSATGNAYELNNIYFADQFSGADAGAQIAACIAALSSSGGICDARGLQGAQTGPSGFAVPAKVKLLLGAIALATGDKITLADDASIEGIGWQTVIQASAFAAVGLNDVIANANTTSGNSRIRVRNLKVDANKAGNPLVTTLDGVHFYKCADCLVEDVWATGARGTSGCDIRFEYGSRNKMHSVLADYSDNIGLSIAAETDWEIAHSIARFNTGNGVDDGIGSGPGRLVETDSTDNGASGFNPDTSGDVEVVGGRYLRNLHGVAITNAQKKVTLSGVHADFNTGAGIYVTNNVEESSIIGGSASNNGTDGILLNATSFCSIIGVEVIDNSTSVANTYDGVHLLTSGGTTVGNTIIGNTIKSTGGTGQRYGVSEDSTGGGTIAANTIAFNMLYGNQTAALSTLAASTVAVNRVNLTNVLNGDLILAGSISGNQLGSTVTTGTPPLVVTSTTPVVNLAITAAGVPNIPVLTSTSGPVADPGGANYYQFNNAAGALTFNAPAGVAGLQRCYRNATGKVGVITIQMAASNTVDVNGANGSSAGTLVSGGALGDSACIVSDATNHWYGFVQSGTWTNN